MLIPLVTILFIIETKGLPAANLNDSQWNGKIFPDPNSIRQSNEIDKSEIDHHGRAQMGVKSKHCDWGEDPKRLDGDLGPQNYICLENPTLYHSNPEVHPILIKEYIPKAFVPWHRCMNESITYKNVIPTYGDHRPLWPKYGEYTFVPKQRWIHSLEHGSVVLLYHPCADKNDVDILRNILKRCLYQYIITTMNELGPERPLVLVAWGVRLEMSKVDPETVINFIRKNAYQAPEKVNWDGQYELNLVEAASRKLLGKEDNICPDD